MPISHKWLDFVPALQEGKHLAILERIAQLRQEGKVIFPPQDAIFRALQLTSPAETKVIILGQDPYHGEGQAQGLAFSVPAHTHAKAFPPSLKNIFKEVQSDLANIEGSVYENTVTPSPCLERWAKQGVLLLNTVLTVEKGQAHSHADLGWQDITKSILQALGQAPRPLAILLWGKPAQSYAPLFMPQNTTTQHLVLMAPHPSPLSAHRGFLGCKHFSAVNTWLTKQNQKSIEW